MATLSHNPGGQAQSYPQHHKQPRPPWLQVTEGPFPQLRKSLLAKQRAARLSAGRPGLEQVLTLRLVPHIRLRLVAIRILDPDAPAVNIPGGQASH